MHISVVITLYDDSRVKRTLSSLWSQSVNPDFILVADGGSPQPFQREIKEFVSGSPNTSFSLLPGRCIDTRRQVMDNILDETDIVCFIDSDEVAPLHWVERITSPIRKGKTDFAGGPLLPYAPPQSTPERILNKITPSTPVDMSYIAMGNSAWHRRVFEKIGNFDSSDISQTPDQDTVHGTYHVSDDYDINLRALKAGFEGKFVQDAYLYHDQSHIDTFRKLVKYQYGNYVRTVMAYLKHGEKIDKFTKATRRQHMSHPFELFLTMLKPIAFLHGYKEWSR